MRHTNFRVLAFLGVAAFLHGQTTTNPLVRFHTSLGDIDVTLLPGTAPVTVANFMSYLNKGAYVNSIFHRSVPGFIIQGGGYQLQNHAAVATPQDAPIKNEFKLSNARGTIAMAQLSGDPNSATNQWFFNLVNNGSILDTASNGPFTVFGTVANSSSLSVMDKIAALSIYAGTSPFDAQPVINYTSGPLQDSNYVLVTSIEQVPNVIAAGFVSAASFASSSLNGISPGELVAIFGNNIGPAQLTTLTFDANGLVTTSLAGTRVLFDGTPGAMIYTRSDQLSVIAPYNLAGKITTRVVVEYQGVQTSPVQIPVIQADPGIFTLNSSGKGDGAIVHLNGSVVNAASPAQVGEIVVLYGEGYGVATAATALPDGAIVGATLPVPAATPVLLIDGQTVDTLYAGGAPSLVNGVLQVNFKVPQLAPGSHQIQLQMGGRTSPNGVTLQTR